MAEGTVVDSYDKNTIPCFTVILPTGIVRIALVILYFLFVAFLFSNRQLLLFRFTGRRTCGKNEW
jgi:hypothetical protein